MNCVVEKIGYAGLALENGKYIHYEQIIVLFPSQQYEETLHPPSNNLKSSSRKRDRTIRNFTGKWNSSPAPGEHPGRWMEVMHLFFFSFSIRSRIFIRGCVRPSVGPLVVQDFSEIWYFWADFEQKSIRNLKLHTIICTLHPATCLDVGFFILVFH